MDTTPAIAGDFGNRPDALLETLHRIPAVIPHVPEDFG